MSRASWREWLTGKAVPMAFWSLFLVSVGRKIPESIATLLAEGVSLYPALELARHVLTLAFIALVGSTYITRMQAVDKARGTREIVFPMFVFLAGIAGMAVLVLRYKVPRHPALVLSGLALASLGICCSLWALVHLRNSFSILAEARRPVMTGPYRLVRHPLYLGEALTMLGLCLTLGSAAALLFWASINALQLYRARIEEEKLAHQFDEYRVYREKTPFILPGLH